MKSVSLYVHIPFCRKKCAYCDFVSWPGRESLLPGYFAALKKELEGYRAALRDYSIRSVYFGGGTPSLADAKDVRDLLEKMREISPFEEECEITLEANPGTISGGKMEELLANGINRLSFGAQSFQNEELRMLGRIHRAEDIRRAVEEAKSAGCRNISLDLMYELPGQTVSSWQDTLAQAVSCGVRHISAYTLICEPGTPLTRRIEAGEISQPGEDACAEMRGETVRILGKAGFTRYEISNYALEGYHSRHNAVYWDRSEYIGIGCAAHSFFGGERYRNSDDLEEYLAGQRRLDARKIGIREAAEEELLLRLRTKWGLDLEDFAEKYGDRAAEAVRKKAGQLSAGGFFEADADRLILTDKGMDVQNAITTSLVCAMEDCQLPGSGEK